MRRLWFLDLPRRQSWPHCWIECGMQEEDRVKDKGTAGGLITGSMELPGRLRDGGEGNVVRAVAPVAEC